MREREKQTEREREKKREREKREDGQNKTFKEKMGGRN